MSPSSESAPSTSTPKTPIKRGVRTNLAPPSRSSVPETLFSKGTESYPDRPQHPPHRPTGDTQVMTFYPTMEEFKDFNGYMQKIERANAHILCGICKVVPPVGWHPRPSKKSNYSDIDDYEIKSPVIEEITGDQGIYEKSNSLYKKKMSVADFRALANRKEYKNPSPYSQKTGEELEEQFFSQIIQGTPIYGADTEGTIYDPDVNEFNMNRLGTVLDETRADGKVIKGVNSVYLYFGMYKTCFPWHAEDMDLYSINYLHFGAPKYWFAISSDSAERFEKVMDQYYPHLRESCRMFLRHKIAIVSPKILKAHGIPYGTMIQRPNEFIITFPKGYHMGFNLGYNCAESTNFATDRWIDFGKNSVLCKCRPDNVEIDMRPFMKKYRPDEFDAWHKYWYEKVCYTPPSRGKRGPLPKKKRSSLEMVEVEGPEPPCRNWMKEQKELWNSSPYNMLEEAEENRRNGLRWPHCAVCQIFNAARTSEQKEEVIPKRSVRLVTSRVLEKTPEQMGRPKVDICDDDLITCSNCQVTVHPTCYGGEKPQGSWLCFRCRVTRNDVAIAASFCCLCEMRGGALLPCKRGTDEGYVHVVCAIFNRRTTFDQPIGPSHCFTHPAAKQGPNHSVLKTLAPRYVTAVTDKPERQRFECGICKLSREGLILCEGCAPDDNLTDPAKVNQLCTATMVHVTCGQRAGFLFEERDPPTGTAMICHRHTYDEDELEDMEKGKIEEGEEVLVYLDNGNLLEFGLVQKVTHPEYLVVQFLDGTVSSNTPPHDVIHCSCRGCDKKMHQKGARLLVKWTDGETYDCYFRYFQQIYEYSVRLQDGSIHNVLRSDLYSTGESMPVTVRKLLMKKYSKGSTNNNLPA